MKTSFKLLLAAGVLSVAGFASTVPAAAQPSSFSFRFGDVAVGYSDGYYDRSHNWHQWRNAREHRWYRSNYNRSSYGRGNYRSMRRDSDRDGIPNRFDRDRDNDGVPNRYDNRPNNPYRN